MKDCSAESVIQQTVGTQTRGIEVGFELEGLTLKPNIL